MVDSDYRKCLKYIQKANGENVAFQKIREFLHRNHNLPTDMLIKKLNKMIQANHHYNNQKIKFFSKIVKEYESKEIMKQGAIEKENNEKRICSLPFMSNGIATISNTRKELYQEPINRVARRVIKKGEYDRNI